MKYILRCGTLIDGTGRAPSKDVAIVVDGDVIAEVADAETLFAQQEMKALPILDATGFWVLPGLINTHDHITGRELVGDPIVKWSAKPSELVIHAIRNALSALRRGWTTVRDMGAPNAISLELRNHIANDLFLGPRMLSCGSPISITGGHASVICVQADGPSAIRQTARRLLKDGADFIKVCASHDPVDMPGAERTRAEMTVDECRAAFDVAHDAGKKAAAHCMGTVALGRILDAGVDVISHGIYLNDELACRMKEQGVFLEPTLSSYGRQTINPALARGNEWIRRHEELIPPLKASFQAALRAGVEIVAGTDTAGRYAEEVAMMREWGMDAMDSLLACTRNAATALGLGRSVGTLEQGKIADLVVLGGDPLADAYNLEKVVWVIKKGQKFSPKEITFDVSTGWEVDGLVGI